MCINAEDEKHWWLILTVSVFKSAETKGGREGKKRGMICGRGAKEEPHEYPSLSGRGEGRSEGGERMRRRSVGSRGRANGAPNHILHLIGSYIHVVCVSTGQMWGSEGKSGPACTVQ